VEYVDWSEQKKLLTNSVSINAVKYVQESFDEASPAKLTSCAHILVSIICFFQGSIVPQRLR
jgi:hypothetical protein